MTRGAATAVCRAARLVLPIAFLAVLATPRFAAADVPVFQGILTNVQLIEGIAVPDLPVAVFFSTDSQDPNNFTSNIDWGDSATSAGSISLQGTANGGGLFLISGTHAYTEESATAFTITITLHDIKNNADHTASPSSTVLVGDAPLAPAGITLTPLEGIAYSGPVGAFIDVNPNPPLSDFSASIDWGDGSPVSAGTVSAQTGFFLVSGDHTYPEEGANPVTVVVNDVGGSTTTINSIAQVQDAPIFAFGLPVAAVEGISFTGPVAIFVDANPNPPLSDFSAFIDWGDGTGVDTGTITANPSGGFLVNGTHTYPEEGTHTLTVVVVDVGGSVAAASCEAPGNCTATVLDAPLTGSPGFVRTTVGTPFDAAVAQFTDANPNPPLSDFSAIIDWGDGTPPSAGTIVPQGGSSFIVRGSHTYNIAGKIVITVLIQDVGGSQAVVQTTAFVLFAGVPAMSPAMLGVLVLVLFGMAALALRRRSGATN